MANASTALYPDSDASKVRTIPYTQPPGRGYPPIPRPFDLNPVIDLCTVGRLTGAQYVRCGKLQRPEGEIIRTAEVLDVDRQRIYRWLASGLTDIQADTIAIILGHHPCLIWPDWFAKAPSEEECLRAEDIEAGRIRAQENKAARLQLRAELEAERKAERLARIARIEQSITALPVPELIAPKPEPIAEREPAPEPWAQREAILGRLRDLKRRLYTWMQIEMLLDREGVVGPSGEPMDVLFLAGLYFHPDEEVSA